jgi:hypothetical protein
VFHLAMRAAAAVRAVAFQLAMRAGVAVRALAFHLAMRAGVAVHALAFQLAMRAPFPTYLLHPTSGTSFTATPLGVSLHSQPRATGCEDIIHQPFFSRLALSVHDHVPFYCQSATRSASPLRDARA